MAACLAREPRSSNGTPSMVKMMYDDTGRENPWTRSTCPFAQPLAFILSSRSAAVFYMYGSIFLKRLATKNGSTMLLN